MRDAGCGMPQTKTTRAGMLLSEQSSPRECPRPTEATGDTSCRCYLRGPDGVRRLSPSGTWDNSNIARGARGWKLADAVPGLRLYHRLRYFRLLAADHGLLD